MTIDIDIETFITKSDEINKKNKIIDQITLLCEYCGNKKIVKTIEDLKKLHEIKRLDVSKLKQNKTEDNILKQPKMYRCNKCGRCLCANIIGKRNEYYS